jgi:hypothetical protein
MAQAEATAQAAVEAMAAARAAASRRDIAAAARDIAAAEMSIAAAATAGIIIAAAGAAATILSPRSFMAARSIAGRLWYGPSWAAADTVIEVSRGSAKIERADYKGDPGHPMTGARRRFALSQSARPVPFGTSFCDRCA